RRGAVRPAPAPAHEPRAALGRPDARADEEPVLLARQQPRQVFEQVERMPLVADRAYGAGALGRRHDLRRVIGRAGDRLLQVYGEPAAERGDRRFPVGRRRDADDDRPEILAVAQVAPVLVGAGARAVGQGLGPFEADVAYRHQLALREGPENPPVLLRYPPGPDHAHPDGVHAASPRSCPALDRPTVTP